MLMTLAITDTDAPRHRNLSVFLIPCNLPGIRILPIDALAPPYKNQLIFEDVRFPADRLVGEGGDGWVAFATRGGEGGGDRGPGRRRPMDEMVDYAKETERNGRRLSQDPDVHEVLTKAYVDNEIHRLLSLRNRWMGEQARAGTGKTRSTYEGGQMTVYNKELAPETSKPCSKLGALWC
jgi:alkylation response protein AidB-like acyl-CoA dehydrogenase